MFHNKFSPAALCLLATTAMLLRPALAITPAQGTPPTLWSGEPPKELWCGGIRFTLVSFNNGDMIGRVTYLTAERKVRIHWAHKPSGVDLVQAIPTPYWPTTAAATKTGNDLLVAGKRRANTNTVIERWDLVPPAVLQDHSGNVQRLMAQPMQGIDTIYDSSVIGQDMVKFIFPRPGFPQQLIVQFWDSKSLFSITTDTEPGTLAILVSKSGGAPFSDSRIGDTFTYMQAAEHVTHGYIIILGNDHNFAQSSNPLIIKDSNKDGTFESALVPTMEQWSSLGFADTANYVPD